MAPRSWAEEGLDRDWLEQRIPPFGRIHSTCKAGQHSVEKQTFLNTMYDEYQKKFPGRTDKWSFTGIGKGGTEAERRTAIISVSDFLGDCF
jgi:hypothetical protein